jgi:prophage regulatory protein
VNGSQAVVNHTSALDPANSCDGAVMPPPSISDAALLRLSDILAPKGPIPVSRSAWWAGVASGRFPRPLKLGPRTTVWRASDIRALLERGVP